MVRLPNGIIPSKAIVQKLMTLTALVVVDERLQEGVARGHLDHHSGPGHEHDGHRQPRVRDRPNATSPAPNAAPANQTTRGSPSAPRREASQSQPRDRAGARGRGEQPLSEALLCPASFGISTMLAAQCP